MALAKMYEPVEVIIVGGGTGGTDVNVLTSALPANAAQEDNGNLEKIAYKTWDYVAGNSKVFTYYTGVEAGNPSGAANLKSITYKTGVTTVIIRTFAYNASDILISITAS